jgi:hypothetical protein
MGAERREAYELQIELQVKPSAASSCGDNGIKHR